MPLLGGGRLRLPKRIDLDRACRRMKMAVDRRRIALFENSLNESLHILQREDNVIGVEHRAGQIINAIEYASQKGFIKAIKYQELKEKIRGTVSRRKIELRSKRTQT